MASTIDISQHVQGDLDQVPRNPVVDGGRVLWQEPSSSGNILDRQTSSLWPLLSRSTQAEHNFTVQLIALVVVLLDSSSTSNNSGSSSSSSSRVSGKTDSMKDHWQNCDNVLWAKVYTKDSAEAPACQSGMHMCISVEGEIPFKQWPNILKEHGEKQDTRPVSACLWGFQ